MATTIIIEAYAVGNEVLVVTFNSLVTIGFKEWVRFTRTHSIQRIINVTSLRYALTIHPACPLNQRNPDE